MKLVIFVHSLGRGGAERVSANLANYLVDAGWTVSIVTLTDATRDRYELRPAVRRIGLGLDQESPHALAAIANNFRRVRALRRQLVQERPDAAIGMMNTASVLLMLAARGLGIVLIGAERGNPSTVQLGRAWTRLRNAAYRRLHSLVALTPEAARWLADHAGARNIAVIPNAVVWPLPDQFPAVDPASVGVVGRKRLLAVGRLTKVKGYDRLLEAFARLAARHADWELVIVGEGPERQALQLQSARSGLTAQVILAGEAGNVADWYRSADIAVLTSRHEGFPNVVLEAMAHGLVCVSFDCEAGPRNIIRHGVDGLLVKDQDIGALETALGQLMNDPDMRARFGAQAKTVRDRFDLTRIMGQWRDLIAGKVGSDG